MSTAAAEPGDTQPAQEAAGAQPESPDTFLSQAAEALRRHRPGAAERALRSGLAAFPESDALHQELKSLLEDDDGDQSDLPGAFPGSPGQRMRDMQAEFGLSLVPPACLASLPNDAFRAAFLGDEEAFRASFRPTEHISLRAWELRLPLPSVIVSGAQRVRPAAGGPPSGHAAIMRAVCEAGCRVDARDVAGYTALHHATAHTCQLALARILLQHGADPSARDRFGTTPLHHAIMSQEHESVALLLEAGADPRAKDLDGVSIEKVARFSPPLLGMVQRALGRHQANAHLESGAPCFRCGRAGAAKRCAVCRLAIYCSKECQKAHWKQHKRECASLASGGGGASSDGAAATAGAPGSASGGGGGGGGLPAGHLRLKPSMQQPYMAALPRADITRAAAAATGIPVRGGTLDAGRYTKGPQQQAAAAQRKDDRTFVVKVQVPMMAVPGVDQPMLIYNKARTYQATVSERSGGDARRLAALIREGGILGAKAYFNAYHDPASQELVVISGAMLPPQPW